MSRAKLLGAAFRIFRSSSQLEIGAGLLLHGWPIVTAVPDARITVGDSVVMTSRSRNTALGVVRPVIIRSMVEGAQIVIGNNVGMSGVSICAATEVTIGDDCLLGSGVVITDTDFHPLSPVGRRNEPLSAAVHRPCRIGKNVFIGAGSLILKGVEIGDNSVIGAGSVVSRDVPANVIAAGNPARVLRSLSPSPATGGRFQ